MTTRLVFRLGLMAISLMAWLAVAACSSGGGRPLDAAVDTFAIDYMFGELPPGCPPTTANDKKVGAPCTKTGVNECPEGLLCTCQMALGVTPPSDTPCFCSIAFLRACTNPAIPPDACGQNASCCSYMGQASLCVPNVCLNAMMCPAF